MAKHDKADKHDNGKHDKKNGKRAVASNGYVTVESAPPVAHGAMPRWDGPVAIVGARLIDGTGGDPIDDASLVFEGERIVALGRRRDVAIPAGATVFEGEGLTLLPGLIDCHVHIGMQAGLLMDLARMVMTPPSLNLLYAVPNSRATLEAGITTVRDAGGTPAGVRTAVERGLFPGPRMLVAVSILSQTGGHGDGYMPCCLDLRASHPK